MQQKAIKQSVYNWVNISPESSRASRKQGLEVRKRCSSLDGPRIGASSAPVIDRKKEIKDSTRLKRSNSGGSQANVTNMRIGEGEEDTINVQLCSIHEAKANSLAGCKVKPTTTECNMAQERRSPIEYAGLACRSSTQNEPYGQR